MKPGPPYSRLHRAIGCVNARTGTPGMRPCVTAPSARWPFAWWMAVQNMRRRRSSFGLGLHGGDLPPVGGRPLVRSHIRFFFRGLWTLFQQSLSWKQSRVVFQCVPSLRSRWHDNYIIRLHSTNGCFMICLYANLWRLRIVLLFGICCDVNLSQQNS